VPAPAATQNSHHARNVGFNLGAIMLALGFAGVGLAYAIDAAGRNGRTPPHRSGDDGTTLTRTIGGKDLEIPLSWFRYAEQRVEGFAKQIDLHFVLPLGPGGAARDIEVTMLPRSGVRPSAGLLDGVYLHMFGPEQLDGPPGLVGKPLKAAEGYRGEAVWYDPLSADPFVAKCSAPVREEAPSRCLRAVHLAPGIAAVYAFDADILDNWRQFDPEVKELLRRIGVFAP
jgi:hypothetical protein